MNLFSIYSKLPVFLQELLVNIQGYVIKKRRFGKNFLRELRRFEAQDPTKVDQDQLRNFLKYASRSPYWNEAFESYNVNIESPNLIKEIEKLPILTKDEVRSNINAIQ